MVTYSPLHENLVVTPDGSPDKTTSLVKSFTPYSRHDVVGGPVSCFQAKVVLAEHFQLSNKRIEEGQAKDSQSEDMCRVGAIRFYRSGDFSKEDAGLAEGIAEGHEGCFQVSGAGTGRYLIVPLISVENLNDPAIRIGDLLQGKVYIALIVLEKVEKFVRIGVVYITARAFNNSHPFLESISLQ